jgi:hypothetical protein
MMKLLFVSRVKNNGLNKREVSPVIAENLDV